MNKKKEVSGSFRVSYYLLRNRSFKEFVTAVLRTHIIKTDCCMACDGNADDTMHSKDIRTVVENYFVQSNLRHPFKYR